MLECPRLQTHLGLCLAEFRNQVEIILEPKEAPWSNLAVFYMLF
jgi:hypothetical protein